MASLTPAKFVQKYARSAYLIEVYTNLPMVVTLAQAALESGWGKKAPKFNFFGYTCNTSYPKKQLIQTTEYHSTKTVTYPRVLSIKWDSTKGAYKYSVKRWFRAYDSAESSFYDYASLIRDNTRYNTAWMYIDNPKQFVSEIAKAGYATDPSYITLVHSIIDTLNKYL